MKELKKNIRNILDKPSTDHLVLAPVQKDVHFIRFSNNRVTAENLFDRSVETTIEAGVNGRTAVLTTDGLTKDALEKTAAEARKTAEMLPQDPEYMPPVSKEDASQAKPVTSLPYPAPIEEKYEILARIFAKMKNAGLAAAGNLISAETEHAVFNTKGVNMSHYALHYALQVTAISEKGSFKDSFYGSDLKKLDLEPFIENIIEKSKLASKIKTQDAGKYTVLLSPAAAAELLMFFFFYNGDQKRIDEGLCGLSTRKDKEFAVKNFHFFSDPYDPEQRTLPPFSPKSGAPCRKADFIRDGRLQEAFATRYYAKEHGLVPNGDGLRNTMYNLQVEGTDRTFNQMLENIENGLYINSFFYIRSVDEMEAVFTGMTRDGVYRIKNGKLINAVNNFRFNENMFEFMANILDIGQAVNTEFGRFPYMTVKDFNLVSKTEF
ncbi:MAG: TldD/PmbA family protein [Elusimicrobiales bacterium]|nr:TldD/PmbA family protein [Elusimicrobiales bacterium]